MPESDPLRFDPIVSSERFDELRASRGAVYGDPKENHSLIAGQWAAILQPWGKHISEGKPLPPHVIALCMVGLKLNRMRLSFHRDNYEDLGVYASMAMKWQQEWDEAQSRGAEHGHDVPKRWRMWDAKLDEELKQRNGTLQSIVDDVLSKNNPAGDAPEKYPTPVEWELKQKFKVAPPSIHQDSKAWETIFPEKNPVYNWHRYAAQRGMTE